MIDRAPIMRTGSIGARRTGRRARLKAPGCRDGLRAI